MKYGPQPNHGIPWVPHLRPPEAWLGPSQGRGPFIWLGHEVPMIVLSQYLGMPRGQWFLAFLRWKAWTWHVGSLFFIEIYSDLWLCRWGILWHFLAKAEPRERACLVASWAFFIFSRAIFLAMSHEVLFDILERSAASEVNPLLPVGFTDTPYFSVKQYFINHVSKYPLILDTLTFSEYKKN